MESYHPTLFPMHSLYLHFREKLINQLVLVDWLVILGYRTVPNYYAISVFGVSHLTGEIFPIQKKISDWKLTRPINGILFPQEMN